MHLFGPCRTLTFRISMVLLFEIFVIPFAASTPLIVLSCLVTTKYLSDYLKNLKRLVKIVPKQAAFDQEITKIMRYHWPTEKYKYLP